MAFNVLKSLQEASVLLEPSSLPQSEDLDIGNGKGVVKTIAGLIFECRLFQSSRPKSLVNINFGMLTLSLPI